MIEIIGDDRERGYRCWPDTVRKESRSEMMGVVSDLFGSCVRRLLNPGNVLFCQGKPADPVFLIEARKLQMSAI